MGNTRPLNQKKYGISRNRFKELYYWCLQYNEWQDELKYKTNIIKGPEITDMPRSHNIEDRTHQIAARRAQLELNCKMLEQTALETDPDIYQFIIKAVTDENITYSYLKTIMGIPCGKDLYYNRRRKFYWILDKKKIS